MTYKNQRESVTSGVIFARLSTFRRQKNIESLIKSLVFIKKCIEALNELQDKWNNKWLSKGKQINKLWWKLSNVPVITKSNLKTTSVWEKK